MATAQDFLPRVIAHLGQLPDTQIATDAIRDTIITFCIGAPVFRRRKVFVNAPNSINPITDGDDPENDRTNEYKLAAVSEVAINGRNIDRRAARNARDINNGNITYDVCDDIVLLRNQPAPNPADIVFAQPPGGTGNTNILPTSQEWSRNGEYARGQAVIRNGLWYTAKRNIGGPNANANTEPQPGGDGNWQDGATPAIRGWQPFRRDAVPQGYEILHLGPQFAADIRYSVRPPRNFNTIPDNFLEEYTATIASGALARIPMQFHHQRTPPMYWEQKWRQNSAAAAVRLVGLGRRETAPVSGIPRAFSKYGYY